MDHRDHVALLSGAVEPRTRWAELGSGTGAFTLALAELIGPTGSIVSVDRDAGALGEQARRLATAFPEVRVEQRIADFTMPLDLPAIDGILMANSLHFVREKLPIVRRLRGHLAGGGRFVLVEYGADRGNPWVPFPLSFATWQAVAAEGGFRETRRIGSVPSRFLGEIYSAVSEA